MQDVYDQLSRRITEAGARWELDAVISEAVRLAGRVLLSVEEFDRLSDEVVCRRLALPSGDGEGAE